MLLNAASKAYAGDTPVSKVYVRDVLVWSSAAPTMPAVLAQSGDVATGSTTTIPITLPTGWDAADLVLLLLARNQPVGTPTADNGVILELVAVPGATHLGLFIVRNPAAGFTVTFAAAAVNRWAAYTLADAGTVTANGDTSGNTTAGIDTYPLPTSVPALGLAIAATNASAVWTPPPGWTVVTQSPSGNAPICVCSQDVTASPVPAARFDRGNDATARTESFITAAIT